MGKPTPFAWDKRTTSGPWRLYLFERFSVWICVWKSFQNLPNRNLSVSRAEVIRIALCSTVTNFIRKLSVTIVTKNPKSSRFLLKLWLRNLAVTAFERCIGRSTKEFGGEGGIRTRGTVSRTHAFQACSLSHSDTSPVCHFQYVTTFGPFSKKVIATPIATQPLQ